MSPHPIILDSTVCPSPPSKPSEERNADASKGMQTQLCQAGINRPAYPEVEACSTSNAACIICMQSTRWKGQMYQKALADLHQASQGHKMRVRVRVRVTGSGSAKGMPVLSAARQRGPSSKLGFIMLASRFAEPMLAVVTKVIRLHHSFNELARAGNGVSGMIRHARGGGGKRGR
eukprot:360488-Chlamydomonas_euryale.AAC.13